MIFVGLFHSNAGKTVIYNFSQLPVIEMNSLNYNFSNATKEIGNLHKTQRSLYNKKKT